jgi:hypothetical protein
VLPIVNEKQTQLNVYIIQIIYVYWQCLGIYAYTKIILILNVDYYTYYTIMFTELFAI